MIKLSEDLMLMLRNKYGKISMDDFVHSLFGVIVEKCLKDGSAIVREFGKFIVFKTESSRTYSEVLRFKFKPSTALLKRLNNDKYILNIIPVKSKHTFSEEHQQKCEGKKDIYYMNLEAQKEAERLGNEKVNRNVSSQLIFDFLQSNLKK